MGKRHAGFWSTEIKDHIIKARKKTFIRYAKEKDRVKRERENGRRREGESEI